jgi:hypothetical protein
MPFIDPESMTEEREPNHRLPHFQPIPVRDMLKIISVFLFLAAPFVVWFLWLVNAGR